MECYGVIYGRISSFKVLESWYDVVEVFKVVEELLMWCIRFRFIGTKLYMCDNGLF